MAALGRLIPFRIFLQVHVVDHTFDLTQRTRKEMGGETQTDGGVHSTFGLLALARPLPSLRVGGVVLRGLILLGSQVAVMLDLPGPALEDHHRSSASADRPEQTRGRDLR